MRFSKLVFPSSALPYLLLPLLAVPLAADPEPGAAQVNVEALRPDDPPPGVSGSLSGDLTVQTGNTDFVRIGIEGRRYHVTEGSTTLVVGHGGIGFLGRNRFASSGLFHYRRTYGMTDWLAPEWYGQANYDRSRSLSFRALAGAGVRSPGARTDWGHVGGGTGLMLEHERLSLPDTASHPRHTTVVRSSSFATLRVVTAGELVVTSTTYIQPQVDEPGDVRVLEDLALATPVTERLALTVSFDLRYDSRPPDDVASLDTRLRTGLTLTYGGAGDD